MHPESDVVFIGDARNVVACWFICQQMCRLLKTVRLSWRKLQGPWGSRAELDEESHQYAKRLAYSVLDNGIFIMGLYAGTAEISVTPEFWRLAVCT
ncbi:hypothetical protein [Salmonella enterica]|uniref:hypothetical protein n=1 Tax=Salmonella enterica TaxID=28901 RepID=UPI0018A8A987|nr:hypothetical protein [Salmonella enterica]